MVGADLPPGKGISSRSGSAAERDTVGMDIRTAHPARKTPKALKIIRLRYDDMFRISLFKEIIGSPDGI